MVKSKNSILINFIELLLNLKKSFLKKAKVSGNKKKEGVVFFSKPPLSCLLGRGYEIPFTARNEFPQGTFSNGFSGIFKVKCQIIISKGYFN